MASESGTKAGIIGVAIAIVFLLLITTPGVKAVLGITGNEETIYAGLILLIILGAIIVVVKAK